MAQKITLLLLAAVAAASCTKPPTAQEVCGTLESAGVAKGCHEVKAEVINARARTKYDLGAAPLEQRNCNYLTLRRRGFGASTTDGTSPPA